MDLLGVGPLEFFFVLLIIFLVLGPNDMAKTGKKIGRFLSTAKKSEFWRGVTQVTREMRDLPTTLMREAELEDVKNELEQDAKELKGLSQEFQHDTVKEIKAEMQASIDLRLESNETSAEVNIDESPGTEAEASNQEGDNA